MNPAVANAPEAEPIASAPSAPTASASEMALYHSLRKLLEPESTRDLFGRVVHSTRHFAACAAWNSRQVSIVHCCSLNDLLLPQRFHRIYPDRPARGGVGCEGGHREEREHAGRDSHRIDGAHAADQSA